MYPRRLQLDTVPGESCFLWGARQTGKSTLLKTRYPDAQTFDLLRSDVYRRLVDDPSIFRQEVLAEGDARRRRDTPVIVDEVQKIPELLDEVHWLIENVGVQFILCGSSARKLRRGHANLLGGRAIRHELLPLTHAEITEFSLERALNAGLLPRHYDSPRPHRLLQSYVADYLQEEIAAEALTRNIPAFSRFLDTAGAANGEVVNYHNIAAECGVSAPTVREYYQILVDTLVGVEVPAYRRRSKRRVVASPKRYLFDVGVAGYLAKRGTVEPGSREWGRAFEHFILMELRAHSAYSELFYPIAYWRTSSGFEVDFVLADGQVAVEVKSASSITYRDLKGLRAFAEEHTPRRSILVADVPKPRRTDDGIEILNWRMFLDRLGAGEILR